MKFVVASTIFLLLPVSLVVAEEESVVAQENVADRYRSPKDLDLGKRLVRSGCGLCHGADAQGGRGPSLVSGRFRRGDSDAAIAKTIVDGIPAVGMPGWDLTEAEKWRIVNYIQSRRKQPSPRPDGEEIRGKMLFTLYKCDTCHWVDSKGGRHGPDLTSIGYRPVEHLRKSILAPSEVVDPEYWTVTVVTIDGRVIAGMRLNETATSVQLIDVEDKFYSIPRDLIEAIRVSRVSLMPDYRKQLNAKDLDDVVSYLWTLRK